MKLKSILSFLNMVNTNGEIWVNDYLNAKTDGGKRYQYCLDAKLLETFENNEGYEEFGYGETYAKLSNLGTELLQLAPAMPSGMGEFYYMGE